MVEAAGIEPYPAFFEQLRRRPTFVVNSKKDKGFGADSLSPGGPISPPQSWRDRGKQRVKFPDAAVRPPEVSVPLRR
jgi:hypothetical protein